MIIIERKKEWMRKNGLELTHTCTLFGLFTKEKVKATIDLANDNDKNKKILAPAALPNTMNILFC